MRKYCQYFEMAKLKSKNWKTKKSKFGRIDSRTSDSLCLTVSTNPDTVKGDYGLPILPKCLLDPPLPMDRGFYSCNKLNLQINVEPDQTLNTNFIK